MPAVARSQRLRRHARMLGRLHHRALLVRVLASDPTATLAPC